MDNHPPLSAESQQYQQYYQHYQPQPQQQEATNPSVAYDPSTQAYYTSYQHYDQTPHQQPEAQPNYTSYYYPDYTNSYQSQPQVDPNSIHPPGVTVQAETPQTLVQNHPDVYYSHGFVNLQHQQPQNGYLMPGHSAAAARGGRGGGRGGSRPMRGRGHHGSSRGRGRGRGGGRGTSFSNRKTPGIRRQGPQPSSSLSGPGQAPPQMAWCELCRVDCNTPDVLDQHKNGKKHKRNLKEYEDMQNLNKGQVGLQSPQTQVPDPVLTAVQPDKTETIIADAVPGNNNDGIDGIGTDGHSANKAESSGGVRGRGLKRKMRGGRGGGKLIRTGDGLRKPVEPTKPKQIVNLLCELCNVKCESQVVFDSHVAGKKHIMNLKKFQGHKAAMGSGVEALYPPIPKAPLTLQTLYPPTSTLSATQGDQQQRLPDAQALAATLVNQQRDIQDPLASQAALAQILNQHGINDAQSLLAQLIPFLLTQVLPNGAAAPGTSAQGVVPASFPGSAPGTSTQGVVPASVPGSVTGMVTQNQLNSGTQVVDVSSGENECKSETVVDKSVQKIESSEGVDDIANKENMEIQGQVIESPAMTEATSTEEANVAGNENVSDAGGDVSCEQE